MLMCVTSSGQLITDVKRLPSVMWEIEKLFTNKKFLDLQLAFFNIQAIVGSIKFADQIFFTNFSHKSVFRVYFFNGNELQVTQRVAGKSKMDTNRGRGMDLSRLDDGPPVLPQSGPHLLPRLPDVLGVGRAHTSSSGTRDTIYYIL